MPQTFNPVAAWKKLEKLVSSDTDEGRLLRWGAAVAVLCGAVLTGAAVARARMRRSSGPRMLGLAALAAGVVGAMALGDRILRRGATAGTGNAPEESDELDAERISHPAVNVQRISFA